MKKLLLILPLLLFVGCVKLPDPPFGGLTAIQQEIQNKPYLQLKTTKDKILYNQDIDDIKCSTPRDCVNNGKFKNYDYISDIKSNGKLIFHGEYSNAEIIAENGDEKTVNFYESDQWFKDIDGVYEIKKATTTIEAFNEQTKISFFEKIFRKRALATNYNSGTGDGFITSPIYTTWAAVRNETYGTVNDTRSYDASISENYVTFYISRTFRSYDTSAIGASATITAATDNEYILGKYDDAPSDGNSYVSIVQTSQASPTALVQNDFDNISFTEGSQGIDLGSITTNAWNVFTLNATGIAFINKTGYTTISPAEGHDINNTSPGALVDSGIQPANSRHANVPYLSITFAGASAPPQNGDMINFE